MTAVVDRAARFLSRRLNRRSFVTRSALAGSALAVAPKNYILRPGTAHAAICSCSGSSCDCNSLCCDGYTDFCCALNGTNACPPGTLLGGWWKVDNSSFCTTGGATGPRYYMDCNYTCGDCGCGSNGICSRACAGADCGCHLGCDHRKLGCTGFRYGQCNQDIACLGPILCRVVTCTPPWAIDSTCGTTVRTDNNTRFHSAPCLEENSNPSLGSLTDVRWVGGLVQVTGYVMAELGTTVRLTDGARVIGRTQADLTEDQVGEQPIEGASWFQATHPLTVGPHLLCASALVVAGAVQFGCIGITVPGDEPIGALDLAVGTVGRVRVAGWALDTGSDTPVSIHVYVDGVLAATALAADTRSDIAARYPEHGATTGFDFDVEAGGGQRRVAVFAINQGSGSRNTMLGAVTVDVSGGMPVGVLDSATGVADGIDVVGWAIDPDTPEPVTVHVYVDGSVAATAVADVSRPGLAAAYPGYGANHGFQMTVPAGPGLHEVCVYAIDRAGGDGNRQIGCTLAAVETSPLSASLDRVEVEGQVLTVAGWALPEADEQVSTIELHVDGELVETSVADRYRPDVAVAFTGVGDRHGYMISAAVDAGSHRVEVIADGRTVAERAVDVPNPVTS